MPVAYLSFPLVDDDIGGRNFEHYTSYGELFENLSKFEHEVERRGFPVLRVNDTFRSRAGDRYLAVSEINAHYNPLAHQLAGDALFEFLQSADWVDTRGPRPRTDDARWLAESALRLDAVERWSDYHQSYDEQFELFSSLGELYPTDPWIANTLAFIHRDRGGEHETCRSLYARLLEIDPQHAAPWNDIALCTTDIDKRERLLVHMLNVVPDHVVGAENLAALDARTARLPRACGCFRRMADLALYPSSYNRAMDGLEKNRCQKVRVEPCPGGDPLALR